MEEKQDPFAYSRAVLCFMLDARQPGGFPVVHAEGLLRELAEDLEDGLFPDPQWQTIERWARTGEGMPAISAVTHRLGSRVHDAYRTMLGVRPVLMHPDWLCVLASPKLGDPRFPAYNRAGERVV